jgi:hypothetical protein
MSAIQCLAIRKEAIAAPRRMLTSVTVCTMLCWWPGLDGAPIHSPQDPYRESSSYGRKPKTRGSTVLAVVCFALFFSGLDEGNEDILISLPSCTGSMKAYIRRDG